MSENKLRKLSSYFARRGNPDHIDMAEVDKISEQHGVDKFTGRQAFFAGRDLRTLEESETLDGGDGSETKRVSIKELIKTTFSKGE